MDKQRVLTMSESARDAGVHVGMRRGGVQMLMAMAQFQTREPERERAALDSLAMALLQFSPQVADAAQATVLIEVSASLRLFGGVQALCRRMRDCVHTLGFTASLACAPTAQGAWLLAHEAAHIEKRKRKARRRVLKISTLQRTLDHLRVSLLPEAAPWIEWLHGIGCTRLAEVRALPRAGLQRRCGKALIDVIAQAYGEQESLFDWVVAPPEFHARIELPDRIEHADALLAYSKILLAQLTGWLSARHLAVKTIQLSLKHERGKQAIPPTLLRINLAHAVWREDHLVLLLKEKLAQLQLEIPVIELRLDAPEVEDMQTPSDSLFPTPGASAQDHQRLIELLVARLGEDNVLEAAPQADHRPDQANAWRPVALNSKAARKQNAPVIATLATTQQPRPSWLLPQAIPLQIRQHRPYYRSPLKLISSAERIEAGWWDGQLCTRDYFVAESSEHICYWIYRERMGGLDNVTVWYLHGVFG
jgi:protein ImuB